MTTLLVTITDIDGSYAEIDTVNDLIKNELERCPACNEIHIKTEHLPFHCNSCRIIRDERWLRSITRRARSALQWNAVQ